ncbi:MAG: hypothetical protein Fur0022_20900 [Anaerolineales bacterium]
MTNSPFLQKVHEAARLKHYSPRTGESYLHWSKQYIFFQNKKHPAEMGAEEVRQFLTHLATKKNVSASTQNQALSALPFL